MPVCDIDQNIVAHGSKGAELQHVTSTGMEWNGMLSEDLFSAKW